MKYILGLFVLVALGSGAAWYWYTTSLAPAAPDAPLEIPFTIEPGTTLTETAQQLKEEGLIKSATAFEYYAERKDKERSITAGRFQLSPSMDAPKILETITNAKTSEPLKLVLPEGITVAEVFNRIVENKLATREEVNVFLAQHPGSYEGYLFPDTYFIDPFTFNLESFFDLLRTTFRDKTAALTAEAEQKNLYWATVISLASMLEKEIKTEEDLPIVAGILWKRLEGGWPLGVDATLLYDDPDGVLSPEDLTRDSLFNTRLYPGLPPTPISNPGLKTLEATLRPSESPYWFYITEKETGRVIYAATREEHEQNVVRFLK